MNLTGQFQLDQVVNLITSPRAIWTRLIKLKLETDFVSCRFLKVSEFSTTGSSSVVTNRGWALCSCRRLESTSWIETHNEKTNWNRIEGRLFNQIRQRDRLDRSQTRSQTWSLSNQIAWTRLFWTNHLDPIILDLIILDLTSSKMFRTGTTGTTPTIWNKLGWVGLSSRTYHN